MSDIQKHIAIFASDAINRQQKEITRLRAALEVSVAASKLERDEHRAALATARVEERERCARLIDTFKADASFEDSIEGARERNAHDNNLAAAIRAMKDNTNG